MKFATLILAALATMATAVVVDVAAPVPALVRDLQARACDPSNCRCNGVAGLFCGNQAINPSCTNGDVFQCNPSGRTCTFHKRNSCVQCGKLTCP